MAIISITIPSPGESISEVTLGPWRKGDGDWAEKDEMLVEIESDKATLEVRAPQPGRVNVKAKSGVELKVGTEIATIDTGAAKPSDAGQPAAAPQAPAQAKGAAASKTAASPTASAPTSATTSAPASSTSDVKATSVAKKMAADKGVDLAALHGTGPSGRITKDDVIQGAARDATRRGDDGGAGGNASPSPASHAGHGPRGVRRERMTKLRQRIAERLVSAQHAAAMLTTFNECDMTEVMRLRSEHKELFEKTHGVGLGFMGFFVAACVSALRKFPRVNASIVAGPDGPEVEYHDFADISVAVGTDKGLVVPVVRNADRLTVAEVERTIKELALKARDNKLTVEEMTGGTFTISNGGVYGSLMSTPILNPPQSAILGMHTIKKRAVEDPANPGQIALRPMMYLALSYDHRIVDGAEAVGFLVHVKNGVEHPERLLLGV